jgi:hypothetical protein
MMMIAISECGRDGRKWSTMLSFQDDGGVVVSLYVSAPDSAKYWGYDDDVRPNMPVHAHVFTFVVYDG